MKDNKKAEGWYTKERPFYEQLSFMLEDDILNILEAKKVDYYNIEARVKEIKSFKEKLQRFPDLDPEKMQDLAAVRIIAYVKSDVEKITSVIKENFTVNKKRSQDKLDFLGIDKVGYQSIHVICKYSPERTKLIEYKRFENIEFEIQIRTILQHAWAEIEHDRNYKFSGVLPDEIQRQLNLLAGSLELTDNQFEQISKMIDSYKIDVSRKTKSGELKIPINTTSLKQYLDDKFGDIEILKKEFSSVSDDIIDELKIMNITTLEDLNNIIKNNFKEKFEKIITDTSYIGLIRLILILHDNQKYFTEAIQGKWTTLTHDIKLMMEEYGLDVEQIVKKYKLILP